MRRPLVALLVTGCVLGVQHLAPAAATVTPTTRSVPTTTTRHAASVGAGVTWSRWLSSSSLGPIPSVSPRRTTHRSPVLSDATSTATAHWRCIAAHESGSNPTEPGGGMFQFQGPAFRWLTGLTLPAQDYPVAVQDRAALRLYRWALRYQGDGFMPWSTRGVCGL